MSKATSNVVPRVLVIDDLFGRSNTSGVNEERRNLCGHFLLEDEEMTYHEERPRINSPLARAQFARGQRPSLAVIGDAVENDLDGSLNIVREGWVRSSEEGRQPWSMLLLDLCFYTGTITEQSNRLTEGMPEGRPGDDDPRRYFGLTLLDAVHREFPELPVFILSSKPREEVSLAFSRRGALGFIDRTDPHGPELLQEALWQHGLLPDPTGEVVGNSLPGLLALREARRAGRHRQNLLIRGERGTGKELLANYIHRMRSPAGVESERPFVKVNSAVFTPDLFAAELFGIQPRTATGVAGKTGLIDAANHGDLFLDEIGDMPADVQAAMLRVLQEREITRVGGRKTLSVDVRFISATNANLEHDASGFRSDLLDRLRIGGTLWLPPLKDRLTDLPLLTQRFVREAEAQHKGALRREVNPETLDVLRNHDWPGNIRELRSTIFDAVNRHPDVEHLVPGHLRLSTGGHGRASQTAVQVSSRNTAVAVTIPEVVPLNGDNDFLQLLERMSCFEFDSTHREAWVGGFPRLQSTVAWLIAKFIKAALVASRKPTPENPQGEILIHPAIKLLTGDSKLTASKAADLIKRSLNFSPRDRDDILQDDVLRQAHDIALRLRPTAATNKQGVRPSSTHEARV